MRKIYWNKERCFNEALKYETRKSFYLGCSRPYEVLRKNKWLNEACSHMKPPHSSRFKWTKEICANLALKYEFRKEFQNENKNAYYSAMYNGWLDEICQHMKYKKLPNKYWHSYKNCKNEALKYVTKTDFVRNSQHVYNISLKNGWIDSICKHLERRKLDRKKDKKDAVNIHIVKTDIIPNIKKLTEYVSIEEAIKMEKHYYDKYLNEGWEMLNRTKTGGLGGSKFK